MAIYRISDRYGRPFFLYVTPISAWDSGEKLLRHVNWVNRSLTEGQYFYNALDPMIQEPEWFHVGVFFFGVTPDRQRLPVVEIDAFRDRSMAILNFVFLSALLRFLECDVWPFRHPAVTPDTVRKNAETLMAQTAPRLVKVRGISKRWQAFYERNAKNVARTHDFQQVFTVGKFLSTCLVYCPYRKIFYLEGPFSFSPGAQFDDLCLLLFLFRNKVAQDKQYLIDFYFNLNVPNRFFTYLSHQSMTALLQQLAESKEGSREEAIACNELRAFAESRDGFRTPVPVWYRT